MRYNGEYNLNLIVFGLAAVVILIGAFIAGQLKPRKLSLYDMVPRKDRKGALENPEENKTYFRKVEEKIKQAGSTMPLYVYFGTAVVTGIIVYAVTYFLIDSVEVAFLCALVGLATPSRILEYIRVKRVHEMENQFTKALRRMSSTFRSGGNVYRAVNDVAKSDTMPEAIRYEMGIVVSDYESGDSFATGFMRLYERTGIEDAKSVALGIEIGTKTGANMAEAFEKYISAIHDRQTMVAEGRATLAGTKTQVTIMCIVPFAFSAFLKISDPTYFDAAYNWLGGFGRYLIIMLYGVVVFGFVTLRRMCDIKL